MTCTNFPFCVGPCRLLLNPSIATIRKTASSTVVPSIVVACVGVGSCGTTTTPLSLFYKWENKLHVVSGSSCLCFLVKEVSWYDHRSPRSNIFWTREDRWSFEHRNQSFTDRRIARCVGGPPHSPLSSIPRGGRTI